MCHRDDIKVFLVSRDSGTGGSLKSYFYGAKKTALQFCGDCGISLFADHGDDPTEIPGIGSLRDWISVNVRTLEEWKHVERSVQRRKFDGASLP